MKSRPTNKEKPRRHDKPAFRPSPARLLELDELLDEALEETFPASDAVSLNQPGHAPERRHRG
jgi:hypothetical protein